VGRTPVLAVIAATVALLGNGCATQPVAGPVTNAAMDWLWGQDLLPIGTHIWVYR
jgi:hypothetical protein